MSSGEASPHPVLSGELGEVVFENMLKTWVDPELERRGGPPKWRRESLWKIVVLLRLDSKPVVLFNDEAKVLMAVEMKDGATKKDGEPVYLEEIVSLRDLQPLGHHDAAHVTAVRLSNGWSMAFDFRYNLTWAHEHARAAREFIDTARDALKQDRRRAAVDNAASAAELAAKAILLTSPDKVLLDKKSHAVIHQKFNIFAKLNVPESQREAFNRLRDIRPGARYVETDPLKPDQLWELIEALDQLVKDAERQTQPRSGFKTQIT